MKRMGFEVKWCKWIESCLHSATMSILVNGSPTKEFRLGRGVRQGDPLSPFLFILAAEGLNAIVNEAVDKGIFRGVRIGDNRVMVSHLQYADDTIFFGEWSKEDARSLMCILKCFEEASGLQVNYNKRKLYEVGVNDRDISAMARWMKCSVGEFLFTYLGLPIGENTRRIGAWNPVIDKFKKRLAEWKAKSMSFGGRLTLVKLVLGSLPLYYFLMFRVPLHMSQGGLLGGGGFGGTIVNGTYEDLSDKEKLSRLDLIVISSIPNIVVQGLPSDVTLLSINTKFSKGHFGTELRFFCRTSLSGTHFNPSVPQNAYLPLIIPQQPQAEFPTKRLLAVVLTHVIPFVQDGRVTVQQVQGRQGQNVVGLGSQGNASGSRGNTSGQAKVVKCYNCQGEGHMARQCTQPKIRRDAIWFKEKVLLVQAQAEGKELDEEQSAFLVDPGVADGQVAQTITYNTTFQTDDDLDAYDSDCDDISSAKAVLMANLSSCDSNVLSEVPYSDTSQNDTMNQSVHEFQYSELSSIVDYLDNELTSDSNIIPYSQYLEETQHAIVQNTNTSAQQNSMILSMFEQMSNHATN
ncbi:reverse transcriptase domain, reverse transcriptase zinc-binding domain protein [Tanacetum coccineum]|uniref:Reverse transcriptase domain, reverse transcriptase zinc-binding domain protein n=1 Tax=Tanacetum coccineum TaxID=301880 RepID=A0ABQ4ZK82_9ASTR